MARADTVKPVDELEDLIVGSLRGLEAWRRDGSGKRTISNGPALHPRWLDAGTVVVVQPNSADDLTKGARIERIVLATGKRRRIANLPPFACAPRTGEDLDWMTLDIHDPSDFRIDRTKGWACVTLMDRNINAASLALNVRIELKSGKVARYLSDGEDNCQAPKDVTVGEEPAETCAFDSPFKTIVPQLTSYPCTFKAGNVLRSIGGDMRKVLRIDGYEEEDLSPSGRWVLLSGDQEGGDYIYRQLALLDRVIGQVFPIQEKAGAWPSPLTPAGKKTRRIKVPIANTIGVVGETDVRWLGTSAESEVLVIDAMIISPERVSFSVDGAIAR